MQLIQTIKGYSEKQNESWALFLCPYCHQEVIKRRSTGKKAKSCGCYKDYLIGVANKKHGGFGTRLYDIWINMKRRCLNNQNQAYKNYGGRGIIVCQEWLDNFVSFKKWALNNGYKNNLTIDRVNNDKGYFPDNCRFVSKGENCRNQRQTKLSWSKVKEIRNRLDAGCRPTLLAKEYGVTYRHIWRVGKGLEWPSNLQPNN